MASLVNAPSEATPEIVEGDCACVVEELDHFHGVGVAHVDDVLMSYGERLGDEEARRVAEVHAIDRGVSFCSGGNGPRSIPISRERGDISTR
jgi:hypothetical protein